MQSKLPVDENVNLRRGELPEDYHCSCEFCQRFLGTLIRPDGSYYSKLERNKYYVDRKRHVAKTPLHLARYCVQKYSEPDDWVLDPTMGAGTTAVESLRQGRNVVGVEIEFIEVIRENIAHGNNPYEKEWFVFDGDARSIEKYLETVGRTYRLVINNPPYSGDQCEKVYDPGNKLPPAERQWLYDRAKKNLALMKENPAYYKTMKTIYRGCVDYLQIGGFFCIGVKDMIRGKKPYLLHKYLGDLMEGYLTYVGMILLPHYPPTIFMSTYGKRYPELANIVPRYQTILIFRKDSMLYGKRK